MFYKEVLTKKFKRLEQDSRFSLEGFLEDYKLRNSELASDKKFYIDLDEIKKNNKIQGKTCYNKRRF